MPSVTVQIPATTSNFGPGFDCLGCALKIYNRVTVSTARRASSGATPHPMAEAAVTAFFQAIQREPFPFNWRMEGDVPVSRGLGSSVTLRLGLIVGLNELAGRPLARPEVFALCAALEGHPDNAAPAAFGGFTVAGENDPGGEMLRFAVAARLKFVLLVPGFEIRTADARRLLPTRIARLHAVASSARACRITAAFASGRYEALDAAGGFDDDAFHQSHRLPLIPFWQDVILAGKTAGALGGFLSGSGSTIACLTLRKSEQVAAAMRAAAEKSGTSIDAVLITSADNRGARIIAT